jgi:hypothetical protein
MQVNSGERLKSSVSEVQVVIVRGAAGADVELTCGHAAMIPFDHDTVGGENGAASPDEGETLIGKRYVDKETGLEILCTKAGQGLLRCEHRLLEFKETKALPSSD